MGRSVNMLIAGIGAATFLFSLMLMDIIFNPILVSVMNIVITNTNPYWWDKLGGNQIIWIIPYIFSLMLASAIMIIIRVFTEIGNDVKYEDESW